MFHDAKLKAENMYGNGRGGFMSQIPPVTKNLIIINVVVWAVEAIFHNFAPTLVRVLGLHLLTASHFNPIQLITYLFLHEPTNPWHLVFNMFMLWSFGSILERIWGAKRYFIFYFVCGIGAGVVQEIVWLSTWHHDFVSALARMNGLTFSHMEDIIRESAASSDLKQSISYFQNSMITIGASGAIYGIMLGFAFVFPDRPLYLFFIPVPIKAKYLMIGYGVIEFFLGFRASDTIAHFAHLGGMLFGLIILLYWRNQGTLRGGRFY